MTLYSKQDNVTAKRQYPLSSDPTSSKNQTLIKKQETRNSQLKASHDLDERRETTEYTSISILLDKKTGPGENHCLSGVKQVGIFVAMLANHNTPLTQLSQL